jgi:EAL domain-containing protein (putative c-di-GMP-specific phosphodiesterase class I)
LVSSGLKPSRLELEVTEGLLIDNTEEVTYSLRELKGMGVAVALDDFGTGYSSLSYLLKFPFDKLKIDRSFISAIEGDEVARNVLEAIAKLGNVLDLKVTAEGVETLDQVKALKAFNCTHFQGFLFGKPLVLDDLPGFLLDSVKIQPEDLGENRVIKQAGEA